METGNSISVRTREEVVLLYKDIDRVSKEMLRQSTPAGWKQYFLGKAKGDKELATALEEQLLEEFFFVEKNRSIATLKTQSPSYLLK